MTSQKNVHFAGGFKFQILYMMVYYVILKSKDSLYIAKNLVLYPP